MFVCTQCGYEHPKWLGRCPSCGKWNTFQEEPEKPAQKSSGEKKKRKHGNRKPQSLVEIPENPAFRILSYITELDRVLGGGIVEGSTIIVGGEPGIGKSTLMIQLLAALRHESVLYLSGEESAAQIKDRASRLSITSEHIKVFCETDLEQILGILQQSLPKIVIVDSIQSVKSEEIGAIAGTVNQVKYCCLELSDWAKETGSAVFLVGHVTKDGMLAGPKVIEHLVDTVMHFEQGHSGLRILRAQKNRFGSVDEMGLFTMNAEGLTAVRDPSTIFLVHRSGTLPPGITSAIVYEGSRSFLVEIQALTVVSKSGYPRVYSDKIDIPRVSRIAAVMEKHLGMNFSGQDIYINVAGGIKLNEVGVELPLALALYSAHTGRPVNRKAAAAGELSLAGEIMPTPFLDRRIKTAFELGFEQVLGPSSEDIEQNGYIGCSCIQEALKTVYSIK